jgi:hypothetical protein
MKILSICLTVVVLSASFSAVVAQQKYSGIYAGKAGGINFLAAVTAGGRLLGLDNTSRGLKDALNPSKSTVNSSGTVKGVTPNGTSLAATINSSFEIRGTLKVGTESVRVSGKRTLN